MLIALVDDDVDEGEGDDHIHKRRYGNNFYSGAVYACVLITGLLAYHFVTLSFIV